MIRRPKPKDRTRIMMTVLFLALATVARLGVFHFHFLPNAQSSMLGPDKAVQEHMHMHMHQNQNQNQMERQMTVDTEKTAAQIPQKITMDWHKQKTMGKPNQPASPVHNNSVAAALEDNTAGSRQSVAKSFTGKGLVVVNRTTNDKPLATPIVPPTSTQKIGAATNSTPAAPRFDILARKLSPKPQFPSDFESSSTVIDILQDPSFNLSTLQPLQLNLQTDMLGILIDAGRHYFPVEWLKRLMEVLSALQYNLIHFRLTDDQAFALQLESQPNLTCPTHIYGNQKTYSKRDIRELLVYASTKNIAIVPEINVPGHAGAWTGIPDLIVPCREFACTKGYGIPLNVSHPQMRSVLTDVLREVIDIFDRPPYLHLGGDEIEVSIPCFKEVGTTMFNYQQFENMLSEILYELDYPEEQVIRWRETELSGASVQDMQRIRAKKRAGAINHWWHDTPGKTENVTTGMPIIGSARLYMDVNENEAAWEIFLHSRKWWHLDNIFAQNAPVNLKGIIVGTFELGTAFFHQRNVIGRLLAVTIGVSNVTIHDGNEVNHLYGRLCREVGFPDAICRKYGKPITDWRSWNSVNWSYAWREWRKDVCERFPKITA